MTMENSGTTKSCISHLEGEDSNRHEFIDALESLDLFNDEFLAIDSKLSQLSLTIPVNMEVPPKWELSPRDPLEAFGEPYFSFLQDDLWDSHNDQEAKRILEQDCLIDSNETFPISEPFILCISFDNDLQFKEARQCLDSISSRIVVRKANCEIVAQNLLLSPHLAGVFVADASVLRSTGSNSLFANLVQYIKNGGTVVLGGFFSILCTSSEFESTFGEKCVLPWKMGFFQRENFELNWDNESLERQVISILEEKYYVKAVPVVGIPLKDAIYRPVKWTKIEEMSWMLGTVTVTNMLESPAVFTCVGKGHLGYMGDFEWQDDSTEIIMAMFNLRK